MTRDEVTNRTPEMRAWAQKEFDTFLGTNQPFTPLSIDKVTMVMPGWKGGVEWGGMTADPEKGILYANVNNVASLGSLADHRLFAAPGRVNGPIGSSAWSVTAPRERARRRPFHRSSMWASVCRPRRLRRSFRKAVAPCRPFRRWTPTT